MSAYTFNVAPTIYMSRRAFPVDHKVTTTLKVGSLTPIDIMETLPGDTWKVRCSYQARLSTAFLRPVMDSFFIRLFHFHVPLRLLYTEFESVFGDVSPNAYVTSIDGEFPCNPNGAIISPKTVGDYLGISVGAVPSGLSVLPFRAFALIYEKWFRNQNTVSPMLIQLGEFSNSETPNDRPWSPNNYTGHLPQINKFNDYFTSCLPNPQKGQPVTFSFAQNAVVGGTLDGNLSNFAVDVQQGTALSTTPMKALVSTGTSQPLGTLVSSSDGQVVRYPVVSGAAQSSVYQNLGATLSSGTRPITIEDVSGLTADLSSVTALNVNDLRFAVQLQKMFERDARGGSRYVEYLMSHYGVSVPDGLMQRPELLGGITSPLNVQQVSQTSQSTSDNPLGSLGAYSRSLGRSRFTKGIVEHGYIITVAAIQYKHSYQQGIPRMFMRSERNDFYDPLFANLGEQPVYKWQLYNGAIASGSLKDGAIFGYNEYAAEYRFFPDTITGQMRSSAPDTFDVWHFADNYASAPSLTQQFTDETPTYFRRATVVEESADVDDFLCEFYFSGSVYRCMPLHSVPGLLDHH